MNSKGNNVDWPLMTPMRQDFDVTTVPDLESELSMQIRARLAKSRVVEGGSVAVGVGSRGVSPIRRVVSTIVSELKLAGLKPFIVPAMGSHGGSTAAGQQDVLEQYGISEETVGCEVRATMETDILGQTPQGVQIHGDANAYSADHVVIVARVKPHTDFKADIESGLCKMLSIGLGKRNGAETIHAAGLAETIPEAATVALGTGRILFGVALVENALDLPAIVRVAADHEFHSTDRELLVTAKRILPRLPADSLDFLVVDEMGKNISGAGMDTNIVGTWRLHASSERQPDYRYLAALRLTRESNGNASGIGMADFTTRALVDAIDFEASNINAITSLVTTAVRVPITFETDEICLETGVSVANRLSPSGPRIGRIKNTMELETFWVTEPVAIELERAGLASADGGPQPFEFDAEGHLTDLSS
ncbi:MAG: lactate racemase domain-containing protein [Chloroflexi bacterium]|nr:lactate racemase domain-containing protein [Chloroflexota bacterium]MCY3936806.1 lactate racemase domain-containing protein [Chloroflexota bacterium]